MKAVIQRVAGARVEVDGKKGWARAAVSSAMAQAPLDGEEVVLHDESIAVSVVFEPDAMRKLYDEGVRFGTQGKWENQIPEVDLRPRL